MGLFQKSVLKQELERLDQIEVNKSWGAFSSYFRSTTAQAEILTFKEESNQQSFLYNLFGKCFGYKVQGFQEGFNLAVEFKNPNNNQTADGAILINNEATAVIELKSSKTKSLDKITNQAFGYLNNNPNCKYVITSNFQKLRFFIERSNEYLEFDLFKISEDEFKLLWLCLNSKSLLTDAPLKLKERSIFKEKEVTDQLYKDFSTFRLNLFNDLVNNNLNILVQ